MRVLEGDYEDQGYSDFVVKLPSPTMTLTGTVTLSQEKSHKDLTTGEFSGRMVDMTTEPNIYKMESVHIEVPRDAEAMPVHARPVWGDPERKLFSLQFWDCNFFVVVQGEMGEQVGRDEPIRFALRQVALLQEELTKMLEPSEPSERVCDVCDSSADECVVSASIVEA